ncbi:MAG: hydrogenase small subunit [Eggerthellaceae bacterium]|jgi:hydrogenase small subunit|nr:hydrogenase small subunit [Eggerthellaceae bacterium]MDR2716008.1 hydrogenase small subunit [Coriobacteriaceae bacterium]
MEREAIVSEFYEKLDSRGVTRRDFMKLCGAVAAAAGIAHITATDVAYALEQSVIGAKEGNLYPVIWMEGASCTGCTESFAQIETPDPATVVLELISLNYSETLGAGAGWSFEEAREQTIAAGNYIFIYEGAVLEKWEGQALRVANEPGIEHVTHTAAKANAVVALGSCAVNGGWMAAYPNPAGAIGVQQCLKKHGIETPVVNVPGCPANPEWLEAVLVDVLFLQQLPDLNAEGKPSLLFTQTIHDNCQRRGHFENGEFVYQFGTREEALGYCLYPLGCRGPQTKANCGITRWNNRRSWCVESGGPCIGCTTANPANSNENWVETNTPFLKRHRDLRVGDFRLSPTTIALSVTGLLAAALVIHGFGMKITGRMNGGADFEKVRKWDKRHPDRSIGCYDLSDEECAALEAEAGVAAPAKPVGRTTAAKTGTGTATKTGTTGTTGTRTRAKTAGQDGADAAKKADEESKGGKA